MLCVGQAIDRYRSGSIGCRSAATANWTSNRRWRARERCCARRSGRCREGAGIGAVVGTMRGGREARQNQAARNQQAPAGAQASRLNLLSRICNLDAGRWPHSRSMNENGIFNGYADPTHHLLDDRIHTTWHRLRRGFRWIQTTDLRAVRGGGPPLARPHAIRATAHYVARATRARATRPRCSPS